MLSLIARTLLGGPRTMDGPAGDAEHATALAGELHAGARRLIGRGLAIRAVDAGSCNGCELEMQALANAVHDLERFGLRFVASPRHADVLMVTGPVTLAMRGPLLAAWQAAPDPKWVVSVGGCALDGGIFAGGYGVAGGVSAVVPVDLHIPGCPPRPVELLTGLLTLLDGLTRRGEHDTDGPETRPLMDTLR